jgi:hypothetical protein
VITVEVLTGGWALSSSSARDKTSFMHATVNRNKRSLTLDVAADGREISCGAANPCGRRELQGRHGEHGLGYDECARSPDIVYVSTRMGHLGRITAAGLSPLAQAASVRILERVARRPPTKAATFSAISGCTAQSARWLR